MKTIFRTATKILLWFIVSIISLAVVLVLVIRFPAVQNKLIHTATTFVSNKTHSRVELKQIHLSLSKGVVLKELFAEDQHHDTLIYVHELDVNINLWHAIKGNINIDKLYLDGLTANITRTLPDSVFNFDFIVNAFVSDTKTTTDTSQSSLPDISIGTIQLNSVNVLYDDAVTGVYSQSHLGQFELSIDNINLPKNKFSIDKLLLSNTESVLELRNPGKAETDTTPSSLLPDFAAKLIAVNNVKFTFRKPLDSMKFDISVGKLSLKPNKVDLNKQQIDVDELLLHQSNISIAMKQSTSSPNTTANTESNNWTVSAENIDLDKNNFSFDVVNQPKLAAGIDYNHLGATGIMLKAQHLMYDSLHIAGNVKQLAIKEQCGFEIKKLRTLFEYNGDHIELANLLLETSNSRLSNYVYAGNFSKLSQDYRLLTFDAKMKQSSLSLIDILYFAPELRKQEIIAQNIQQHIGINGRVKGSLNDIVLENLNVQTATQTAISVDGTIHKPLDIKAVTFDLHIKSLLTGDDDLKSLLPKTYLPTAIQIPNQVLISGNAKGNYTDLTSVLNLKSSEGSAFVNLAYENLNTTPTYIIHATTDELNLGNILKQEQILGKVSCELDANGTDFSPQKLVANITGTASKIELKQYPYTNITFTAALDKEWYKANFIINDTNLHLSLDADVSMRKENSFANVELKLGGANLKELKLVAENYKTQGNLTAHITNFDLQHMQGNVAIGNVIIVKEKRKYVMDSLLAVTINSKRNSSLSVKNSIVNIDYKGETGLHELNSVLQNYITQYFGHAIQQPDTISQSFTCAVQLNPHPILSQVFLPQLKQFNGLTAAAQFNSTHKKLTLTVDAPIIQYGSNTLKELKVKIDGDSNAIKYQTSLLSISTAGIDIPRTILEGTVNRNKIHYNLKILRNDTGYKMMIAGNLNTPQPNEMVFNIDNGELILNNELWTVDASNKIQLLTTGINIHNLHFSHLNQSLTVNSVSSESNAPIDIRFEHFNIGSLSQIIEKDSSIIDGILDGNVHIKSLNKFAFTSDLNIQNIALNGKSIGNITVKANNLYGSKYAAEMILSGNDNNAVINGFYENEKLNLHMKISQFTMQSIEAFIPNKIKRSEGYLVGNINVSGEASNPSIDGQLNFKNTSFHLPLINNRLSLKNERISFDNKGIYFHRFTVLDSMQQPLKINGSIYTTDFKHMKFDVDMTTEKFSLLNTTVKDNPVYYGKILLSSSISIAGTERLPIIKADAELLDGSNLTFVVQQGELSSDKGDGVVEFVDSAKNAMGEIDSSQYSSRFKGINFNANIEVNKRTAFKIITDKTSGDNLEISGDAVMNFGIDPSGKMSLTGTYILSGGNYKATFQKITKRNFVIKNGSSITWSGDPLDASIDLTATYKARTGASDLLAVELAGMTQDERNAYRKLLNYDVNLLMKGVLLRPQLNFQLDMPPKDQAAFNGMVYAKIQQINNDPNEVNKQAFSILILGRFLPVGTSANTSTTDAVSAVARNSVNQLLSDQLNNLSGKYVTGAELNFNLQSNDDYTAQGTQQNTDLQIGLKKELFNNRVVVQVGSTIDVDGSNSQGTSGQNITGDMLMEYKITEDGAYRFKAFRENGYEGAIDGLVYRTGIGLKYTRDYDSISQLFVVPKKVEPVKTEEEKVD